MWRVLRPGGRLLLDHVAAAPRTARAIQWLLERVTIPLGGEYLRRRPLLQVQAEGFQVERRERTKLGIVERLAARKPAEPDGSARRLGVAAPASRYLTSPAAPARRSRSARSRRPVSRHAGVALRRAYQAKVSISLVLQQAGWC